MFLFFFACPKKKQKKTIGNEYSPFPDVNFNLAFGTVVKGSGAITIYWVMGLFFGKRCKAINYCMATYNSKDTSFVGMTDYLLAYSQKSHQIPAQTKWRHSSTSQMEGQWKERAVYRAFLDFSLFLSLWQWQKKENYAVDEHQGFDKLNLTIF
jgi:hypothetical protein